MKTLEQLVEQFTGKHILEAMADLFRANDREFFDDEIRKLTAETTLKKELPADFSPSVEECIKAHEIDVLAQIVYAGYNGFAINRENFRAPYGFDFVRMEFFDIAREHIIGSLPVNRKANETINAFYEALPEHLKEYHSHISEYYTHFECAGPKLAHYAGYILANQLLHWIEPGYIEDPVQTMHYADDIKKYCGYLPL